MTEDAEKQGARVEDLTWQELEQRVLENALAVLPVGSKAKEHGFHLPLNTDAVQVEWLCDLLIRRRNVLVWPTMGFGFYPAFVEFPGSLHLRRETFLALLNDVADSIARSGHKKLCVINSGISTIEPLNEFVAANRVFENICLINIYGGERYQNASKKYVRQPRGGHADERETSLMLHVAPGSVQMDKAVSWPSASRRAGVFKRSDSAHDNFTPSGIFGDATLASADKGTALAQAMLDDVFATVDCYATS